VISAATLALAITKPNIILIMADDIGAECFGIYGGESYQTPNIDQLARDGIQFNHCYSQPLCTPSRVKIMTGHSNLRNYSDFSYLDPDQRTFGHMLQDAGYRTIIAGKWQLLGADHYGEGAGKGSTPTEAGFDEYALWQVKTLGSRYWEPQIDINGRLTSFAPDDYGPDKDLAFIKEKISQTGDQPFFAYWPTSLPHDPFVPAPGHEGNRTKNNKKHFRSMVEHLDKLVGSLRSYLEESGLDKNTILLFTGDNGTHTSITSRWRGQDYKGGKRNDTNAATWVPLVAWGAGISAGRVTDDLVDFSDFLPTFADAAGVDAPKNDGVSFLGRLTEDTSNGREWVHIYSNPRPYQASQPRAHFVRDHRWKLHRDGRLFDMTTDIFEQSPILPGEGSIEAMIARLRLGRVFRQFPAVPARIRPEGWDLRPQGSGL
jgi:arylsulfatase A-like enzyme